MWKIEKIVRKGDYNYAVVKDHPFSGCYGYVLEHRVVMENHLGRLLSPNEVVHHKDRNGLNNDISNLEVMDSVEHSRIHGAELGRKWVDLKCPSCKQGFSRPQNKTFLAKTKTQMTKYTCCSRTCRGKLSRAIQLYGITAEVESAISENIVREYVKYSTDNPEETRTMGSVETIRTPPETVKI